MKQINSNRSAHHAPNPVAISDEQLRLVSGGLNCSQARLVATVYATLGDIAKAGGDHLQSAADYNLATGVLTGGCQQ